MAKFEIWDKPPRHGGPSSYKPYLPQIILVVLGILLLGVGSTLFYRVEASDEGVVLRFGQHVRTVPPGLHFKLPWPVEQVHAVPVQQIQTLEFGFQTEQPGRVTRYAPQGTDDIAVSEMLTGDLNLAHVEWIVQYRVKNSLDFLFKIGGTELPSTQRTAYAGDSANPAVADTVRDVSEFVMRKLVGDTTVDAVLTVGRDRIASDAKRLTQEILDGFESGVEIVTVKLQSTSPPEEVADAFQSVNRARQNKERSVNLAEGERNSKIPAARGARDQAISEAEGYRERVTRQAQGEVNAFLSQLAEYEKAPEITRIRLYLQAMEEVLAAVPRKTIVDESVPSLLPMVNLESVPASARERNP